MKCTDVSMQCETRCCRRQLSRVSGVLPAAANVACSLQQRRGAAANNLRRRKWTFKPTFGDFDTLGYFHSVREHFSQWAHLTHYTSCYWNAFVGSGTFCQLGTQTQKLSLVGFFSLRMCFVICCCVFWFCDCDWHFRATVFSGSGEPKTPPYLKPHNIK